MLTSWITFLDQKLSLLRHSLQGGKRKGNSNKHRIQHSDGSNCWSCCHWWCRKDSSQKVIGQIRAYYHSYRYYFGRSLLFVGSSGRPLPRPSVSYLWNRYFGCQCSWRFVGLHYYFFGHYSQKIVSQAGVGEEPWGSVDFRFNILHLFRQDRHSHSKQDDSLEPLVRWQCHSRTFQRDKGSIFWIRVWSVSYTHLTLPTIYSV